MFGFRNQPPEYTP